MIDELMRKASKYTGARYLYIDHEPTFEEMQKAVAKVNSINRVTIEDGCVGIFECICSLTTGERYAVRIFDDLWEILV